MSYRGSQINLSAYRFAGSDGIARYWDENGKLIEPTIINAPVERYVQITETVQRGRGKRPHAGMDFKAPEGTPVRLPFAATVTRVNWSRRVNGNCIELELPNGRILHFLHLARIAPEVKPAATLQPGTPLGEVGTTGHSNAPHLHYEILEPDGHPLEPMEVHGTGTMTLGPETLPAFQAARAGFDRSLAQGIARTEPAPPPAEPQAAPAR
jgi:murein DD-endopeptidase MepM/ murein hydrolase activator NlpD